MISCALHHIAAERLPHRLMAEAHAEASADRPAPCASSSRQMPASFGVHGPGDRITAFGFFFSASRDAERIIAHDFGAHAEILDVMDEVVDEAVVIIDDEDHGRASWRM